MSQAESIQRPNSSALVVDKDETARALVRAILSRLGFRVVETADGFQALSVVGEMPCLDLLITETQPPGLDGTKLAEAFIRRCPSSRAILTAPNPDTIPEKLESGGAWVFIPKQHLADLLVGKLRSFGMAPAQQTILLAEDEPMIRKLVQTSMTRAGYSVLTAQNGTEALEISRAYGAAIDLVISDLIMPGITGTELARVIRQERPEARILLMSGHEFGLLQEALEFEFLPKPFTPKTLLERVRCLLRVEHSEPGLSFSA